MALKLKVLGTGQLGPSQAAIYGPVTTGKAAVVRNMRFVNFTTNNNIGVHVLIKRTGEIARYVLAKNTVLNQNQMLSHSDEIALESNDSIEAYAGNSNTVQYVLSGIERDT